MDNKSPIFYRPLQARDVGEGLKVYLTKFIGSEKLNAPKFALFSSPDGETPYFLCGASSSRSAHGYLNELCGQS